MKNKIPGVILGPITGNSVYQGFIKMFSSDEVKQEVKKITKCKSSTYNTEKEKNKAALLKKNREEKLYHTIGKNMEILRKRHGTSRKTVAKLIGVSDQQISKYEKGIDKISISSLFVISEHFNVPVKWIL